jgi:hypothetical protein
MAEMDTLKDTKESIKEILHNYSMFLNGNGFLFLEKVDTFRLKELLKKYKSIALDSHYFQEEKGFYAQFAIDIAALIDLRKSIIPDGHHSKWFEVFCDSEVRKGWASLTDKFNNEHSYWWLISASSLEYIIRDALKKSRRRLIEHKEYWILISDLHVYDSLYDILIDDEFFNIKLEHDPIEIATSTLAKRDIFRRLGIEQSNSYNDDDKDVEIEQIDDPTISQRVLWLEELGIIEHLKREFCTESKGGYNWKKLASIIHTFLPVNEDTLRRAISDMGTGRRNDPKNNEKNFLFVARLKKKCSID